MWSRKEKQIRSKVEGGGKNFFFNSNIYNIWPNNSIQAQTIQPMRQQRSSCGHASTAGPYSCVTAPPRGAAPPRPPPACAPAPRRLPVIPADPSCKLAFARWARVSCQDPARARPYPGRSVQLRSPHPAVTGQRLPLPAWPP